MKLLLDTHAFIWWDSDPHRLTPQVLDMQQINKIDILTVRLEHVPALDKLPPRHKDPFDRLLIAQTDVEEAVLVSQDPIFAEYPVRLVW